MTLRSTLALLALGLALALASTAQAQATSPSPSPSPTSTPTSPPDAAEPVLATPPVLRELIPADLPPGTAFPAPSVEVLLGIDVDAAGAVEAVRVEQGAGEPFDGAALAAARRFRFEPGRLTTGEPVPVTITFKLTISAPPPPAPAEAPPPPPAPVRFAGRLVERGTRRPLAGVAVAARAGDLSVKGTTDADGRFALAVPATAFSVVAAPPGHQRLEAPVAAQQGEERDETF